MSRSPDRDRNQPVGFDRRLRHYYAKTFCRSVSRLTPSLHIEYKHSWIKQYHKEGLALRTETTINDSRDFSIDKSLPNPAALRKVGFQANRHLLKIQRISQDCAIGKDEFRQINEPVERDGERASALRFANPVTQGLFAALLLFRLLLQGFFNRELREKWASCWRNRPKPLPPGRRDIICDDFGCMGDERVRGSHRYLVTKRGWRSILLYTCVYSRVLRPWLSEVMTEKTECVVPGCAESSTTWTKLWARCWRQRSCRIKLDSCAIIFFDSRTLAGSA